MIGFIGDGLLAKHLGPGPHPSGSPQSVHGRKLVDALPRPDDESEEKLSALLWGALPRGDPRGAAKEAVVMALAHRTGIDPKIINRFIYQWAHTSSDNDMRSLHIQAMAAKEFGLRLSRYIQTGIAGLKELTRIVPGLANREDMRPLLHDATTRQILRAMYENTQEWFRRNGYEPDRRLRLYRGLTLPEKMLRGYRQGDEIEIEGNPLESWSSARWVAEDHKWTETNGVGVVLEASIPVSEVVGTPRSGFGCLPEEEFVVMGSAPRKVKIASLSRR